MRAVDLIYAKRQGEALAPAAIEALIHACVKGTIPDYQLAAWLMAVFFRGLDERELSALTRAMMHSGEVFDLSAIPGVKADKHSTGGVGDKVSLILAPLAAACGLIVPMVAGRGLGHTGGTLDKLESIAGYNVQLNGAQLRRQLKKIGVAIVGQTDRFVPADKKLYALRDVTATVESIPLIAASIMSKKMAEGCEALLLDIKVGNGAFMKDLASARLLGRTMIGIGRALGRKVAALITDMNQPTGQAIGNANEVAESIAALQGRWPEDLKEITLALTARLLILAGQAKDEADAQGQMERAIASGAALDKFRALVEAQGGDPRLIDHPERLPLAPKEAVIAAPRAGTLAALDTRAIGVAAAILGAGRATRDAPIDPGVGVWLKARLGERVERGQPIFTVRYRKPGLWDQARPMLEGAITIGDKPGRKRKLILERLDD